MTEGVPKLSFDEYYEMLKEFIESPEAHVRLAEYNAEVKRYCAEGGESTSPYEDDDRVYEAKGLFEHVGIKVLERHGWGDRRHMAEVGIPYDLSQAIGFCGLGEMFINGKLPDWLGGDAIPPFHDKESAKAFLKGYIARRNKLMSTFGRGFPIDFGDNHD